MKFAIFSSHIETQPYVGNFNYSKISYENIRNYCNHFGIDFITNTQVNPKYCLVDGKHDQWNGLSGGYAFYYSYQKFNIIQILERQQYDYVMYLDSDLLLTKNMGHFYEQFNLQNKKFFGMRDHMTPISNRNFVFSNMLSLTKNYSDVKGIIKTAKQQYFLTDDTLLAGDMQIFTRGFNPYKRFQQYKQFARQSIGVAKLSNKQSLLDGHMMILLLSDCIFRGQIDESDIRIEKLYQTQNRQYLYDNSEIPREQYKIIQFSGAGSYTPYWRNRPQVMHKQYTLNRQNYW